MHLSIPATCIKLHECLCLICASPLQAQPDMQLSSVRGAHQVGNILSCTTALPMAQVHYNLYNVRMPGNCLHAELKIAYLPDDNIADKKRKQRGPRRLLMPTDLCAPIQTPAEEALYWQLYQDPTCKNRDGSDNFLVMAGRFNQQWGTQVSRILDRTCDCWLTCVIDSRLVSKEISINV